MKDLTPIEAGRWMDAAPKLVQDAVTSPATRQVLGGLSQRYALHIDVAGLLEKLTSYVLLGYAGPEDFLKELIASGVSDKDAREIMAEINQKIFIPLRAEEQRIGMSKVPQAVSEEPTRRTVAPPAGVAPKRPSTTERPNGSLNLLEKEPTVPPVAPLSPKAAPPARSFSTLGDVVRSVLLAPVKPLDSRLLLEDHEEPSPSLAPAKAVVPEPLKPVEIQPVADKKTEQPEPIGSRIIPNTAPVNLPGTLPEVQAPVPAPRSEFRAPLPVTPAEPASIPSTKSYAVDPYREPVDGE